MANTDDQDDKTEEPTARKLEEARRRGDVIYSPEATAWLMLAVVVAGVAFLAGPMAREIGLLGRLMLERAHLLSADGDALVATFARIGAAVAGALGVLAILVLAAAVLSRYVQDRPAFSAERLKPQINRINPIEGAKRVFGLEALANFIKSAAKLTLVAAVAAWALWPRDGLYSEAGLLDPAALLPAVQDRVVALVAAVLIAFTIVAIGDFLYVRFTYRRRNRMSRQELKEEYKQTEGDPLVRAKLRQIRSERARKRMMAAVPQATVVVTNPTHYAVALKYEHEKTPAPICVAKGVDDVALRIRETAREAGVPIIEDPPLARALYATADLDRAIPQEHYEAVAKIIGLVMGLAQRRARRT